MYTTLRPGLMVAVRTSVKGNVHYRTQDLGSRVNERGEKVDQWDTERTTTDPEEQARAIGARSLARSRIQCVCIQSEFSLLCPTAKRPELEQAIVEATAIANEFNRTANVTRLEFNVMVGEIAADDVLAIRGINAELRGLMETMTAGIASLDVEAIRKAANKAVSVSKMLTVQAQGEVQRAIETARKTARELKKAIEVGAAEVDTIAIERINAARTAFLDLDDTAPAEMEAPVAAGRGGLELDPDDGQDDASELAPTAPAQRSFEL